MIIFNGKLWWIIFIKNDLSERDGRDLAASSSWKYAIGGSDLYLGN